MSESQSIESAAEQTGHQSLPDQGSSVPPVALADVNSLINYIKRIIPALLEDNNTIHPSLETVLSNESSLETLKRFISDSQIRTLHIQRASTKGNSLKYGLFGLNNYVNDKIFQRMKK